MNICVITDNRFLYENFLKILSEKEEVVENFDFFYSKFNHKFSELYKNSSTFLPIRLKDEGEDFFSQYELFISLHCKQLFPSNLVENYRCINIHPGMNPYNRGWFPQVFSILNKMPVGVTIHEMDTALDHGPIIYQEELEILSDDTSFDVYQRILSKEIELLEKNLDVLVSGDYEVMVPQNEGNINYKYDFDELCKINLKETGTFGHFIDILRATTFENYDNAYFYDKNGDKIYISINLKKTN